MDVVDEALDLDRVLAWLDGAGIPLAPPVQARLLAGGRSNLTFALDSADSTSVVVRRPPLGHVLPSAHDMGREHRMLTRLHARGFAVPAPIALCEDTTVIGAPFQVMEFVAGDVVATREQADALGPEIAERVCDSLVTTLATLHAVPVTADETERAHGYLARQVERWRSQWSLTQVEPLADVDALADGVAERIAALPPGRAGIVHGDYRIDNVILDSLDHRVRAVVDWEMATIGDPVADLGIALVYWTQGDDALRAQVPVSPGVTSAAGFWSRAQVWDAYRAQVDDPTLDSRIDAATALACFKLAVIMESIRMRARRGEQRGVAAGEAGIEEATAALAALGLAVLRHGAIEGLRR
mgnify:FL=1